MDANQSRTLGWWDWMLERTYVVQFPAEHAVMNASNHRIEACPTEQEADEYIKMMEEVEDNENINNQGESI